MKLPSSSRQILLVCTLLATVLSLSFSVFPVKAQPSGLVCLADSGTTACPNSPPTFTGSPGSSLTIAVNIQNSSSFNAFDIRIHADPTVINGTSVSVTGSVLQNPVVVDECVNGFFMAGACQSSPGIVNVIIAASSSTTAPTTGRLFSVTYNIIRTSTGTAITYPTGCSSSSVAGTTTCVAVSNGGATVPENVQAATFSNSAPAPDFAISANPSHITIPLNTPGTSTITVTALNGFTGTVFLTTSSTPGLGANVNPHNVTGSGTSTLTVSSANSGNYNATVTGTSGSLSHSTIVSVSVTTPASGLVCMGPSGSNICPRSPPAFNPSYYIGASILPIAVNVQNSPAFNGFDVAIKADPALLNGTGFDNVGHAFISAGGMVFIVSECINGHPIQGNCSSQDGPGIAHIAATSNVLVTGGHLFNVTYRVIGTGSVTITYQTGCTNTSNDGSCVTIVNAGSVIPENLQGATFSNAPDFTIRASPTSITIPPNTPGKSTIVIAAVNGFNGIVSLTTSSSPGLAANISPHNITGSGNSILIVSAVNVGNYSVTVTGASGSLSHSTTVSVMVAGSPPDFTITANPYSQSLKRGSSTTFTITIKGTNNFNSTVNLTATISPLVTRGPTASLPSIVGPYSTSTMTVSTQHNTPVGSYTITVTATSGSLSHTVSVTVTVTK
jgi:hypothetical protein